MPHDIGEAFWKDLAKNRLPNGDSFTYVVTRVTKTVEKSIPTILAKIMI